MLRPLVRDLMATNLIVVKPHDTLAAAARKMDDACVRHLPVVDDGGVIVGVLSQRDLLAARELAQHARDCMSSDVVTVAPDTPAFEAAYLMLHKRIGCLPVSTASGALVGLITESDFVRAAYALLGGRVLVDDLEDEERASKLR